MDEEDTAISTEKLKMTMAKRTPVGMTETPISAGEAAFNMSSMANGNFFGKQNASALEAKV